MALNVLTIAGNAFRETVRQPVFCVVLGVAIAGIALSPSFSMFTLMEGEKLVQDMGLSTILLAGLLLAVLSASHVVTEEIRGRTALMVITRPVSRASFVLGKFLGIALAQLAAAYLLTLVLAMTIRIGVPEAAYTKLDNALMGAEAGAVLLTILVALGANFFFDKPFPSAAVFAALIIFTLVFFGFGFTDKELHVVPYLSAYSPDLVRACIVVFPTVLVLTAVAVACATRLSLVASIVGCLLFYVVGILNDYVLGRLAASSLLAAVPYTLLPNFQVFWMGDALSAETPIPWIYVRNALGYGVTYSAALVFLAMFLFETREIQ
ncbi:hypothetical protein ACFL09_01880 [Planctomycetota bacterium]